MTVLINSQSSNGMFMFSGNDEEMWNNSAFNIYAGKFEKVRSECPTGLILDLWITALAVKIMELKMPHKKDLWELVATKSKKCLLNELKNNHEECSQLLNMAEKYIIGSK